MKHHHAARAHKHMCNTHEHSPEVSSQKQASCCSTERPATAVPACCEPKPELKGASGSCCSGNAVAAHEHAPKQEHRLESAGHHDHHDHVSHSSSPQGPALKDPVCGMNVSETSPHKASHEGETFYFCSAGCRTKFEANPQQYLTKQPTARGHGAHGTASDQPAAAISELPEGTTYTCPMHPEVRPVGPGTCPKCGMALEPEMPTAAEEDNPELRDFRRRFWWTLPLTVIVTVLGMFGHRFGWMDIGTQTWVELLLSAPIVLWAGFPFFERGVHSIIHRSPNMWTLIGLGTSAAFV